MLAVMRMYLSALRKIITPTPSSPLCFTGIGPLPIGAVCLLNNPIPSEAPTDHRLRC